MNHLIKSKLFHSIRLIALCIFVLITISCGGEPRDYETNQTDYQQLETAAYNVYTFGFPIVENYKFLSTHLSSGATRSTNTFIHKTSLLTPSDREIINPNNDTLNSSIVFDLRSEPVVIGIPEITDRYFSIQLINMETENIAIVSSESEGSNAKDVLLVGPNWDESSFENTEGFEIIRSDSELLVGFVRIGVRSINDLEKALAIQQSLSLDALSSRRMLPVPIFNDSTDWPEAFDTKTNSSLDFFNYLSFLLEFHNINQSLLDELALLGMGTGDQFSESSFNNEEIDAINRGVASARQSIRFPSGFSRLDGWNQVIPTIGNYGEDYHLRAITAWYGIYAMSSSEVIYFNANTDTNGNPFNSDEHNYVLTLSTEKIPQANYFWSITIYDEDRFLVENEIERYSLGDRSESLSYSDDGSLSIYIQPTRPEDSKMSNWLPSPGNGRFFINVRIYGPSAETLTGEYRLPGIQAIGINNPE